MVAADDEVGGDAEDYGWPIPPDGAIEGVASLTFDRGDVAAAVALLRDLGVPVYGVIPELGRVQVGYEGKHRRLLAGFFEAGTAVDFDYPSVPPPVVGLFGSDGPVGARWREILRVPEDSLKGAGVIVAVLDVGDFSNADVDPERISVRQVGGETRRVRSPTEGSEDRNHAGLVAETLGGVRSLASEVTLLGWDVSGGTGQADTFSLAQGIIAAVAAGAEIINISLGSVGDSRVLAEAVAYAHQRGVVVVAAAGNNASDRPTFPAAYSTVVGVAATDRQGQPASFSNRGVSVAASAPGVLVGGFSSPENFTASSFLRSGTSFAAPLYAAAVATVMSDLGLPATDALQRLQETALDAGPPGNDPYTGSGTPNLQAALREDTRPQPQVEVTSVALVTPSSRVQGTVGVPAGPHSVGWTIQNTGNRAVQLSEVRLLWGSTVGSGGEPQVLREGQFPSSLAPGQSFGLEAAVPPAVDPRGAENWSARAVSATVILTFSDTQGDRYRSTTETVLRIR